MLAPGTYSIITRGQRITLRCPVTQFYVYLLHFDKPYYHARHYLGVTCNLDARLTLHRTGNGAKLMRAVSVAGIGFEVARLWTIETWEESRALERALKRRHNGPSLCPICQGKPLDALVLLRQGKRAWSMLDRPGKRQPMSTSTPPLFGRGH